MLGPEFQINTTTVGRQDRPAVAAGGDGNFVVVWKDYDPGFLHPRISGQRFDADGSAQGAEFQVTNQAPYAPREPAVAVADAGEFVVIWERPGAAATEFDVFGQRFSATANKLGGEFQVNTYTPGRQRYPAVSMQTGGDFVVVWQGPAQDGSRYGILGQRFDASGVRVGSEFKVNSFTASDQQHPAVAADAEGNFVVAWGSYQSDDWDIHGRRFDAAGVPRANEFQVNTFTTHQQWVPSVASDSAGNFVVAWSSAGQDAPTGFGAFAQRFGATGERVGQEFQVNTYTSNYQNDPKVAIDDSGEFVVAWQSYSGQDGSPGPGIFGQRFAFAGGPVGHEFQVNTFTPFAQAHPAIASGRDGHFVVAWNSVEQDGSDDGVFGQRLDTPVPACHAGVDALCLHNNRFRVEVSWRDDAGRTGAGRAVPFTDDSGLFWFFTPDNLEVLIKVIDGCELNQHFWVYAGATTDVEYRITVTDTATGLSRQYANALGHRAAAITDSAAFASCNVQSASRQKPTAAELTPLSVGGFGTAPSTLSSPVAPLPSFPELEAVTSAEEDTLFLRNGRFRVRISWHDYAGRSGTGWAVPFAEESGMFWFFAPDNIEFLVKIIDGCSLNSRYWVYAAATTDVEYTMNVTDTLGLATRTYSNPLGTASPAITDSSAFATCP
ncbi:MAG: hypothetical protein ABI639_03920 [Thermoanaerobaculia bacterium]